MPPTVFLFRDAAAVSNHTFSRDRFLPVAEGKFVRLWEKLLLFYEGDLARQKRTGPSGEPIRLIKRRQASSVVTFYPPHSLRVSLLTALFFEGRAKAETLMKLAGHAGIVMTLYYLKSEVGHTHEVLTRARSALNENMDHNYVLWLRTHEREKLASEIVFVDQQSAFSVLPEHPQARTSIGWLRVSDGWCLAGGNTAPSIDSNGTIPGCHNGGKLLRTWPENTAHRIYEPVPPRECAGSRCRWLVTGPEYLDALVAKLNLKSYLLGQRNDALTRLQEEFRCECSRKYDAELKGVSFDTREHAKLQIQVERAEAQVAKASEQFENVLHMIGRCLDVLKMRGQEGAGKSLVTHGTADDVRAILRHVDSELLQVAGICLDAEIYPELKDESGEAIYRQSQILDRRIQQEFGKSILLSFNKDTQLKIGNRVLAAMATSIAELNNVSAERGSRFELLTLTADAIEGPRSLPLKLRDCLKKVINDQKPRLDHSPNQPKLAP